MAVGLLTAVQPVMAASDIAGDHFIREISNGWGQADRGGNYSLSGSAADFWVSTAEYPRGLGYINAPAAGSSRAALLRQAQATNVEIGFSVEAAGFQGDGPFYVYAVTRNASGREVRAKVILNRNCTVSTNGSFINGGREQALGPAVSVPGVNWCGGSGDRTVTLRAQVSGTTVRIKVWSPVTGSPANWQWTGRSSSLPGNGAVGLRVYVSSSALSGTTFEFYNWYARAI